MANKRSKVKAKQPDPLPEEFNSIDEAAEFWDTHSSADYEEFMEDVEFEVDIKQRTYLVSLDGGLYQKVSAIARERGIPTETLVNLWIEEKAS
ncbi:MAG: CopG family antitoxin [Pyrinomonadaceae bacterium]